MRVHGCDHKAAINIDVPQRKRNQSLYGSEMICALEAWKAYDSQSVQACADLLAAITDNAHIASNVDRIDLLFRLSCRFFLEKYCKGKWESGEVM